MWQNEQKVQSCNEILHAKKCEENIGEVVDQEEKLCNEVETVTEFTYHGDRVSAGGGCEAAVTARRWHGWVKFNACCMTVDFL